MTDTFDAPEADVNYDRAARMVLDNGLVANESAANIVLRNAEAKYALEHYARVSLPAMLKVLHEETGDLGYAISLCEQITVTVVDHTTTESKVHELARTMAVG